MERFPLICKNSSGLKEGFKFLCGHKVVGGSVGANSAKVIIENNKTKEKKELEADIVLVATGHRPSYCSVNSRFRFRIDG